MLYRACFSGCMSSTPRDRDIVRKRCAPDVRQYAALMREDLPSHLPFDDRGNVLVSHRVQKQIEETARVEDRACEILNLNEVFRLRPVRCQRR